MPVQLTVRVAEELFFPTFASLGGRGCLSNEGAHRRDGRFRAAKPGCDRSGMVLPGSGGLVILGDAGRWGERLAAELASLRGGFHHGTTRLRRCVAAWIDDREEVEICAALTLATRCYNGGVTGTVTGNIGVGRGDTGQCAWRLVCRASGWRHSDRLLRRMRQARASTSTVQSGALGDRAGATLEWSFGKAERGNAAKESILWWRSSRWCRCALLCACGGDDDTASESFRRLLKLVAWRRCPRTSFSSMGGVMMEHQPCCACLWVKTLSIPGRATTTPLASCPPWRYHL
jgi:hypothetical protein